MLRPLPNALTLGNMICGFWGIVFCLAWDDTFAAVWMMVFAALLDVADGALARMLRVSSPLGKDLDSLADGISFGILPGALLFKGFEATGATLGMGLPAALWIIATTAVPAMAVLRLARFNNDPGQAKHFRGVPTPATAMALATMFLALGFGARPNHTAFEYLPLFSGGLLAAIGLVLAGLMVSPLPLLSFKLGIRTTWPYWLAMTVLSLVALPWVQGYLSLVFILVYVVVSQAYFIRYKTPANHAL